MRGPKRPVTFNQLTDWTANINDSIKYYSGTAGYKNTFNLQKPNQDEHIYLNFTNVKMMAKVEVNGVDAGGMWTTPWQVDITIAVKNGENKLEVAAVNTWVNRPIGDSMLPEKDRQTWTSTPRWVGVLIKLRLY